MELDFKLDLEAAVSASQGGRIITGVYGVSITKAYIYKTENGNNVIDLELRSENGEVGFVNRLCIDQKWTSGSENFDYPRFQELAAACGMKTLTLVDAKRKTQDAVEDAKVIGELMGKQIKVAVYEEIDVYKNKEVRKLKLANTFLADGRSVSEAQAKKPAYKITKVEERLTKFETKAYKQWKANGSQPSQETQVEVQETPAADTSDAELDAVFN